MDEILTSPDSRTDQTSRRGEICDELSGFWTRTEPGLDPDYSMFKLWDFTHDTLD